MNAVQLPPKQETLLRKITARFRSIHIKFGRFASTVLLIINLFTVLITAGTIIQPATAYADALGYPWPSDMQAPCQFGAAGGQSCVNPNKIDDKYNWGVYVGGVFHKYREAGGYEYRNCTDYTAWRLESVGVPASKVNGLGNGGSWYNNAPASERSLAPKAWDAAVVPGKHVVFVESVNANGTITVSEYNRYGNGTGSTWTGRPVDRGFTEFVDFGVHPLVNNTQAHYQPFAADFNGDHLADIGMRDAGTGMFYIKHGTGFNDQVTYQWAAGANYQPFVADFNSDGYADIGLRDTNTGTFYIKHGPDFNDQITYTWAAGANYQPFAGDFNGDGYADIGMRDTSTGTFYIKHGPGFNDQITYPWAAGANYTPVIGDFNGDHLADIGLRDANTGTFYFKHGTGFNDQWTYSWATGANYQPYAADFNGDGLADIGMRDPNNGNFYIKHGSGFNDQLTYTWVAG